MKEKDIQSLFSKNIDDVMTHLWVKLEYDLHIDNSSAYAFELKISKDKIIAFDRVAEHQEKALQDISNGFYHKISDSPIFTGMKTRFTAQKPFDCFYINKMLGFVVICWYEERKKKECHFIMIGDWLAEKEGSTRKSLTYEKSKEISTLIYELNAKTKK